MCVKVLVPIKMDLMSDITEPSAGWNFFQRQRVTQTAKNTRGETGREGEGEEREWRGRNINETGVKEKYWADVAVQMQNA